MAEALEHSGAGSRELKCSGRDPLAGALQNGIISVGEGLARLAF